MSYEEDEEYYRLRRLKAAYEAERARLELQRIRVELAPSLMVHTIVRRQGGQWMCIHPSSEDELECPVAYGSSPNQAMMNFDALWMGLGIDIDPDDPENKDSELEEM